MRPVEIPEELTSEIDQIKRRFHARGSALMPALYAAEKHFGWLSPEALQAIASLLHLPPSYIRGVATFYSMYRHKPMGTYIIMLCTNVSCMLLGSDEILERIKEKYGISAGETTTDGRFTLIEAECLGQCDGAPAMLVGEDVHIGLTSESVINVLEQYS